MSDTLEKGATRSASNGSLSAIEKTGFGDRNSSGSLEVASEAQGVDVVVGLFAGHADDAELEPTIARKLRAKLDWHILPLLFLLYILQFLDKNSLGASSILGIIQDNHLNTNQFNNLSSAFYIGYIIFVWPHSWLMQRFPIGKYIAINILCWSLFIGLQAACHNYGGLFILRFLLGASEGCITSGIMTITSMFYNRTEIAERIGWTVQCNSIAVIISGFMAFGVVHLDAKAKPARWEWFMIILAIASFVTSVLFFFFFPDNPASATFLTQEEKVMVVQRIRVNQNGIETKIWKKAQLIEALKDIKTWYFFLFAAVAQLHGGVGVQYSIIIKDFGFSTLETTVLNVPSGLTVSKVPQNPTYMRHTWLVSGADHHRYHNFRPGPPQVPQYAIANLDSELHPSYTGMLPPPFPPAPYEGGATRINLPDSAQRARVRDGCSLVVRCCRSWSYKENDHQCSGPCRLFTGPSSQYSVLEAQVSPTQHCPLDDSACLLHFRYLHGPCLALPFHSGE